MDLIQENYQKKIDELQNEIKKQSEKINKLESNKSSKITNKNICIYPDCNKFPLYNIKGVTKPMYCIYHKLPEMVNVVSKTCIYPGCTVQPSYNIDGVNKPLYCMKHKLNNMINVKDKLCLTPNCDVQVSNKYKGYCFNCYRYLFPNEPIIKNYKTKESSVISFINESFPSIDITCDKIIQDGCSKRRPDILIDLGYQILIVEVDENQHNSYDCICDNKRLMEISKDLDYRPIVFIRFNPDEYLDSDNYKVTSCWGLNQRGLCVVKKINEWNNRLNVLKNEIEYWLDPINVTDKTIEIIQLFYDLDHNI